MIMTTTVWWKTDTTNCSDAEKFHLVGMQFTQHITRMFKEIRTAGMDIQVSLHQVNA